MIQAVITIAAVLTVALVVINFLLLKASKAQYLPYYPSAVLFGSGLVLFVVSAIVERTVILDAPIGGWGIAFLFAAGISFIITAVSDVYVRA